MNTGLLKTPLHDEHKALGARMVPFGGWDMPVQYSGVMAEHHAVRQAAGLFDVSHMGRVAVRGKGAEAFLDHITTNDVKKMTDGRCQYSLLCREDGGIVDDIIISRNLAEDYLVVVNASNRAKDFSWMQSQIRTGIDDVVLTDESDVWGLVAIQGPKSVKIVEKFFNQDVSALSYYHFKKTVWKDATIILWRTGYTGEDGFEIFVPTVLVANLWRELLFFGKDDGLLPVGLGARDTLRLEAAYSLYGHELSDSINPLEAGLGWVVKFDKGDFVGREALIKVREKGVMRTRIGFELSEAGIARDGCGVFCGDKKIGVVTSGTHSPTLGKAIGLALVDAGSIREGDNILLDIRGKKKNGLVVKTPFYTRLKK